MRTRVYCQSPPKDWLERQRTPRMVRRTRFWNCHMPTTRGSRAWLRRSATSYRRVWPDPRESACTMPLQALYPVTGRKHAHLLLRNLLPTKSADAAAESCRPQARANCFDGVVIVIVLSVFRVRHCDNVAVLYVQTLTSRSLLRCPFVASKWLLVTGHFGSKTFRQHDTSAALPKCP